MSAVAQAGRASVAVVLGGAAVTLAMWWFAHAHPLNLALGLSATCVCGYAVGALLVGWRDDAAPFAWAVIRTIVGLLLTTLGFLASLVFDVPWFVGPAAVVACAVGLRGAQAFAPPRMRLRLEWNALVGTLLAIALVAPIVLSAMRMAPGEFPPMFFNVDTPYSLEKVHALAKASIYLPPSLSNLGGRPVYHLGIQGMAALVARVSGLPPHHALFLLVLPLLAIGIVAAALVAAEGLAPAVPLALAVPLLVTSVPSLWHSFSAAVGPALRQAALSPSLVPLDDLTANAELWGVASIVCHNVGAQFIALATLAAFSV
jgi:hypothetical protein